MNTRRQRAYLSKFPSERGISLVEILVSVVILAILSMNVLRGMLIAYTTIHHTFRNSIAAQLALSKVEELAQVDAATLSDTSDEIEVLVLDQVTYTRATDVTIETNRARTIVVTVTAQNDTAGGQATITNTFPLRGTR